MNSELVRLLKNARNEKNLRQIDVAEALGVKNNTLSNWEKGRTEPDIDTFMKLCEIYDINYSEALEKIYRKNKLDSEPKKEPAPETDSLEWLRQGLLDFGIIKNKIEISDEDLLFIVRTIEVLIKGLKQNIIK